MDKGKSWKIFSVTPTKREMANTMNIELYGNFSFWMRVIGLDLTSCLKQQHLDKIYATMVFRQWTLDNSG